MKNTRQTLSVLALSLLMINPVFSQHNPHAGHQTGASDQKASQKPKVYTTRGTVEGIDKATKTLKLWHEPIAALKWPSMTMNFSVEDVSLLEGLKVKDKVRFDLKTDGQNAVVVDIEVIK